MATTKFIIRKDKLDNEGRAPIYVQYCHNRKTALIGTGKKVDPDHWNAKEGKLRKSRRYPELEKLDTIIKKKKTQVEQIVDEARWKEIDPTTQYVKDQLNGVDQKRKEDQKPLPTFFELIDSFIEASKHTKAHGTLKGYRSGVNHLKAFEKHRRKKISFEDMNRSFYDSFCNYLFEKENMSSNTVGRYIKTLKVFLNYAVDQGVPVNPAFHKFKVFREATDIVYLSEEELHTLKDLDLSHSERLTHCRDVFLFGCYTGLRFSDISQLSVEHITPKGIQLRTQKTRDQLFIPLLPQAKEILDRYEGQYFNALPVISIQKMNDYIKEVAELASLDDLVLITTHKGAKKKEERFPKYQLVTTHTARRTFITLSLEKGMRPEVLMQITGHKDFKTLMRYVKIVDSVKEDEMLGAWGKV